MTVRDQFRAMKDKKQKKYIPRIAVQLVKETGYYAIVGMPSEASSFAKYFSFREAGLMDDPTQGTL